MKTLPPGLQAHLDQGTTTLCHCWRLTLMSGERLGFTDHDEAVFFDATTFEASAGFTGSEIQSSLGFSVDNMEARGALQSAKLDVARLRAGDFDHATIEIWRVNWVDPAQRLLLRKGHLGEVTTEAGSFAAEVRGLAHVLNQQKGRLFQFGCDAILGDARCGFNLSQLGYRQSGAVTAVEAAAVVLSGISFADDWATRGVLNFISGAGNGKSLAIKRHRKIGSAARVEFWATLPFAVVAGDAATVTAGCDKQFQSCKGKFVNATNFRGFPHMPGNDFVAALAKEGDPANDGGRRG
jgi:uncharacterized phage protein (TIGR02218 family)